MEQRRKELLPPLPCHLRLCDAGDSSIPRSFGGILWQLLCFPLHVLLHEPLTPPPPPPPPPPTTTTTTTIALPAHRYSATSFPSPLFLVVSSLWVFLNLASIADKGLAHGTSERQALILSIY